jgi:hypothetical protein
MNSSRMLQTVVAHREQARKMREDYALSTSLRPITALSECAIGTHVRLSTPTKNKKPSSAPTSRSAEKSALSAAAIIAVAGDDEKTGEEKVEEWQGSSEVAIATGGGGRPTSAGRPPSPGLSKYAHINDPNELRRLLQQLHSQLSTAEKKKRNAEGRVKLLVQQVRTWKAHAGKSRPSGAASDDEEDPATPRQGDIATDGYDSTDASEREETVGGKVRASVPSDALRELSDIASSTSLLREEESRQLQRESGLVAAALGERWAQAYEAAVEIRSIRELRALLMEAVSRLTKSSKGDSQHQQHSQPSQAPGVGNKRQHSHPRSPRPSLFVPKLKEASIAARHQQLEELRARVDAMTIFSTEITAKLRSVGQACGRHASRLQEGLLAILEALGAAKSLLTGSHNTSGEKPTPTAIGRNVDSALAAVRGICDGVSHIAHLLDNNVIGEGEATAVDSRPSSSKISQGATKGSTGFSRDALEAIASKVDTVRQWVVHDRLSEEEALALYHMERNELLGLLRLKPALEACCQTESFSEPPEAAVEAATMPQQADPMAPVHAEPVTGIVPLLTLCVAQMHTLYIHSLFGVEKAEARHPSDKCSVAEENATSIICSSLCLSRGTVRLGPRQPEQQGPPQPSEASSQQPVVFPTFLSARDEEELLVHIAEVERLLSIGLLWEEAMNPVRIVGCSSFLKLVRFSAPLVRRSSALYLNLTTSSSCKHLTGVDELKDQAPSFVAALKHIFATDTSTILRKDLHAYRRKRELARAVLHQVHLLASTHNARARFNWRGLLKLHKLVHARDLVAAATQKLRDDLTKGRSSLTVSAKATARNEHWIKIGEDLLRMAVAYFADVAVHQQQEMALLKSTLRMSADAAFEHLIVLLREAQAASIGEGLNVSLFEVIGPQAADILNAACAEAKVLARLRRVEFAAPAVDSAPPKPSPDTSSVLFRKVGDAAVSRAGSAVSQVCNTASPVCASVPQVTMLNPAACPSFLAAGGGRASSASGLKDMHAKIAPDEPFLLQCSASGAVLYDVRKLRLAHKENPWLSSER